MFNVCAQCGLYHADKEIDSVNSVAICPECGHKYPFRQLPLLLICGPSGAGKSTIVRRLSRDITAAVMLEGDILWQSEFATPEDNHRRFFETWLRVAKNISQAGRPVVLFIAGALPSNVEPCIERRYFSQTHYLSLVCDNDVLADRLRQRPSWRESGSEQFINDNIAFNDWLKTNGAQQTPPLKLLDTTADTIEQSSQAVAEWIGRILSHAHDFPS